MIRTQLLRPLSLIILLLLSGCLSSKDPISNARGSIEPLNFSIPTVERVDLASGSQLYLQENHELPLIHLNLMTDGGALYEPAQKKGLVSLLAASMRGGGAGELTADQLDAEVEQLAADLSVSGGTYRMMVGLTVQSKDFDRMLDLLFMMITEPRFDEKRLEITRSQMIEGVRRRNDRAASIASREFNRTLYADHAMGLISTEKTITAIDRDDLIAHHTLHFGGGFRIGITGDFDRQQLIASLNGKLSSLAATFKEPVQPEALGKRSYPGKTILFNKDVTQTNIRVGMVGMEKSDPDFYPLQVMNFILGGGGFNSRLMREIRSNRGLAYSVYSYFSIGRMLPGVFVVGCETKNESVAEVVKIIEQEIARMGREPVSAADLSLAKESMINSFIFAFDDQHKVLSRQMLLDYFDYPEGYLENYRQKIAAVTIEDIKRVAETRLKAEEMVTILVGPEEVSSQFDYNREIEVRKPE